MKKLLFLLLLVPGLARAQFVVTVPIAESQAAKQAGHQGFLTTLKAIGNGIVKKGNLAQRAIGKLSGQTVALHEDWYASLLKINGIVRDYRRVQSIWDAQTRTLELYTENMVLLRQNPYLQPEQVQAMVRGYRILLADNVRLLDDLGVILSPNTAKMTDAQRLKFINKIADKATHQYQLVAYFTRRNQAIAARQQQAAQDSQTIKRLYGLPQ